MYAAVVSGQIHELTGYQQVAWGWGLLIDLGFVTPPMVSMIELPANIPAEAQGLREGFIMLAEIKEACGIQWRDAILQPSGGVAVNLLCLDYPTRP
ncbi:MAG: hypothetical protein HPY52_16205 [Firmicutes bacterium]|nr:hypothetical protein [Bacillota bacterium]